MSNPPTSEKTTPAQAAQEDEFDSGQAFDANKSYAEEVFNETWRKHRSQAYNDYRRQWEDVPRNKIETTFPLHLDIETTNLCNLRCPMCPRTMYEDSGDVRYQTRDSGFMTREEYIRIIDEGMAHGLKSIKLNYLSEPLAHKDVVWQVAYAKEKGVIDVMMNSNATLLNKRMAKDLFEAGLDAMFVSFDAISPALYAQQRVGTTVGRVIDNLYEFIKLRDEQYPSCHVRVSMVMYDDPKWRRQFEGLKIMWEDLVDAVGYGFYVERDQNLLGEYPEVPGFMCSQPFQRMFLKYNGNVTICCVDDGDEEVLGNWREQSLQEIWHGDRYREIRRLHGDGYYYQMALCRKCYVPHAE